jgi:hypothetical protein
MCSHNRKKRKRSVRMQTVAIEAAAVEEEASTVDDAVNTDSIVVEDAAESCAICFDRPRAVRMLPCGHSAMCELCTIRSGWGPCPIGRCEIERLCVVHTSLLGMPVVRRMKTHGAPEVDGRTFENLLDFLQAMLSNADPEVAGAASEALALQKGARDAAVPQVPEGHVNLGASAFDGQRTLVTVSLPSTLQTIGESAFFGCSSLRTVSLPSDSQLTSIGSRAFAGCTALTLINLPAGLRSIGLYAFTGCTRLALTSLPEGLVSIGVQAFSGCSSLALSSLPVSLTFIGRFAFADCRLRLVCSPRVCRLMLAGGAHGGQVSVLLSSPNDATRPRGPPRGGGGCCTIA